MPPKNYWKFFTTFLTALIATILSFSPSKTFSAPAKATLNQTIDDRIARVRQELEHQEETSAQFATEFEPSVESDESGNSSVQPVGNSPPKDWRIAVWANATWSNTPWSNAAPPK